MIKMFEIFSTDNNTYIYDGNSSNISYCSKQIEFLIKNYYSYDKNELFKEYKKHFKIHANFEKDYSFVNKMISKGMYYKNETYKCNVLNYKENQDVTGSALILVLTEMCNMRCSYCIYSDSYSNKINFSNRKMTIKTAKAAIDLFFAEHLQKEKMGYTNPPEIGFYGGEPLLEKETIKEIMAYIKSIRNDITYHVTTNALVLDDELCELFAINKVLVCFSLDGYKENHDRNRLKINGESTFDIICSKILRFKEIKEKYNDTTKITFNCCYDYETDLDKCVEFFVSVYNKFPDFTVNYSMISPYETNYYDKFKNRNITLYKSLETVRDKCFNVKVPLLYRIIALPLIVNLKYTLDRFKGVVENTTIGCRLLSKLAVYPDGNITICERMNKKFPVGNVNDGGIDWNKLKDLKELFKKNIEYGKCSICSIQKLCNCCYMYLTDEGDIDKEFCDKQKTTIIMNLINLYKLLEVNPNAFDLLYKEDNNEIFPI